MKFKKTLLCGVLASSFLAQADDQKVQELEERIEELEKALETVAESVEEKSYAESAGSRKLHIGGYGEVHYNNLDVNGSDKQEIDVHRLVLFMGYDYSDSVRLVTEIEFEHALIGEGKPGEVEVEQAYIEVDLNKNTHFRAGMQLMPVGIINETHEPPAFYGVERPVIENKIIPTTWFVNAVSINQQLDNGFSYDLMVSEGLETADPTANPEADPFALRGGRQKGAKASMYDPAITGRFSYRGISGLDISAYLQHQSDLDQGAEVSYADGATLMGTHLIYQWDQLTFKALYARWDLDGAEAAAAGKDVQDGSYIEASWKPNESWGLFVRQSNWSQSEGQSAGQTDIGFNYYPHPKVVFKADFQTQNEDAGNADGFNLGVGFQF